MTAITTQHTPGPWTARPNKHSDGLYWVHDERGDYLTLDEDEHEANARLIAAAPELLKVLESIVRNHSLERVQTQLDGTDLYDALAAIAKAKGGAA